MSHEGIATAFEIVPCDGSVADRYIFWRVVDYAEVIEPFVPDDRS